MYVYQYDYDGDDDDGRLLSTIYIDVGNYSSTNCHVAPVEYACSFDETTRSHNLDDHMQSSGVRRIVHGTRTTAPVRSRSFGWLWMHLLLRDEIERDGGGSDCSWQQWFDAGLGSFAVLDSLAVHPIAELIFQQNV